MCCWGPFGVIYIFLTIGLQKSHNYSFVWPFTQSPQAWHKDTVQIFSCKLKHVRRVLQSSRGCCRASEIPSLSFVYLWLDILQTRPEIRLTNSLWKLLNHARRVARSCYGPSSADVGKEKRGRRRRRNKGSKMDERLPILFFFQRLPFLGVTLMIGFYVFW